MAFLKKKKTLPELDPVIFMLGFLPIVFICFALMEWRIATWVSLIVFLLLNIGQALHIHNKANEECLD